MKIRRFPAAATIAATFAVYISSGLFAGAVEVSTPNPAVGNPAPAVPPIRLTHGAEDILKLARAKVSDDVTVAFIENSGRRFSLNAEEIVYLRAEGVTDRVLAVMLNQASRFGTAPESAPPPASVASAPQYTTAPAETTFVETAPASTVYVASTPAYYSFYDPWPYWSYWYPYPYVSFGFYWGSYYPWYWNYGYCHKGYWNNYCHGGNPPPPNGNPPSPDRVPGANRPENRTAGGAPNASPSSMWSTAGNPTAANGPTGGQANIPPSRNSQAAGPLNASGSVADRSAATRPVEVRGANQAAARADQSVAARPSARPAGAAPARNAAAVGPTRTWSGGGENRTTAARAGERRSPIQLAPANVNRTSQQPAARPTAGPSVSSSSFTRSVPVGSRSIVTGSRPATRPVSSYSVSPSPSSQRNTFSPSYSPRPSGGAPTISRSSAPSFSRPSMSSAPSRSRGGGGEFRGGGSFGGTGASRPSGGFSGGGGRPR